MLKMLCPLLFALALPLAAEELPAGLSAYVMDSAPAPAGMQLRKGDHLAICGDSITEQRQYSLIIESYLTACLPELEITCRQYGWSGEQAFEFLARMKNDVLRFKPTIATTCYGMNDFRYVPYDDAIAKEYRENQSSIVKMFKENGCRVIVGSPGTINSVPPWVKTARGTQQDLNLTLCKFRNIALEVSKTEQVSFADIYKPMLLTGAAAEKKFTPDFKVNGKDGVHPSWAGQVVMAYTFLKAMGINGDIGTITWDAAADKAEASAGHEVISCTKGVLALRSTKLPFSPGPGPADKDDSIRAGLGLVPFDDELNRFSLKITSPQADFYNVTWGASSKRYSASELKAGVSLTKDFPDSPLVPAFKAIWNAALAKQLYETRQIKTLVHGLEGQADMEGTINVTEKARAKLAAALAAACKPAEHSLTILASE